jgi:threonine/homoserine/homoserine lactone efflux protein
MCAYAFSMSISPGPVNIIRLNLGLQLGFRHTPGFVAGAALGFALLLLAVGLGLGRVASAAPLFLSVLGWCGVAFIFTIGFRIAVSKGAVEGDAQSSSSFGRGLLLQWLNPKAWVGSISGIAAFQISSLIALVEFVGLYFVIGFGCVASRALLGDKMRVLLDSPQSLRWFNRAMGALLMMVALYLASMPLLS